MAYEFIGQAASTVDETQTGAMKKMREVIVQIKRVENQENGPSCFSSEQVRFVKASKMSSVLFVFDSLRGLRWNFTQAITTSKGYKLLVDENMRAKVRERAKRITSLAFWRPCVESRNREVLDIYYEQGLDLFPKYCFMIVTMEGDDDTVYIEYQQEQKEAGEIEIIATHFKNVFSKVVMFEKHEPLPGSLLPADGEYYNGEGYPILPKAEYNSYCGPGWEGFGGLYDLQSKNKARFGGQSDAEVMKDAFELLRRRR